MSSFIRYGAKDRFDALSGANAPLGFFDARGPDRSPSGAPVRSPVVDGVDLDHWSSLVSDLFNIAFPEIPKAIESSLQFVGQSSN